MEIVKKLHDLYRTNFVPSSVSIETLQTIFKENGYSIDSDVPKWFIEMIERIQSKKYGEFTFQEVGSDIGSIFQEIKEDLGWDIDDFGEGIVLKFPVDSINVFISREYHNLEAGHGCSCRIEELNKTDSQ